MRTILQPSLLILAMIAAACTDPVKDHAIDRLGQEKSGIPEGPEHRPGQPCVLCHSEGGTASGKKFAIAGTIYDTKAAARGAENVKVVFVDSAGSERQAFTNAAGNFFIRESEWPDLTFPFKTGVARGNLTTNMSTTVNREGSCNFCHVPGGDPRESIDPIFAPGGAP